MERELRINKKVLDERLIKRTTRYGSYPSVRDLSDNDVFYKVYGFNWNENNALKRNGDFTKRMIDDLERLYKKIDRDWELFWQFVEDFNPQFCFICGKYILVKHRDSDSVKRPYKNGDLVHDYCWTKEMTVERSLGRLGKNDELICHIDLGWSNQEQRVCRRRVMNNPISIAKHMILIHGWDKIPKPVQVDIDREITTFETWSKNMTEKSWFTDNGLDYEIFRNFHFLRPNGKPINGRRND